MRYDLQWLETITTDTNNVSPRVGVAWSPFESRRTIVRGSAGLFYDRVPLRALANALMSAGNTTDAGALRQFAVSLSPTQAGAPVFPNILPAAVPAVTLPNLTTMDRNLQNGSSRQVSAEVERQLGDRATLERRLPVPGRPQPADVGEPERADLRGRGHQQRLPARYSTYANNSQYSSVGDSTYHGLHVSLSQHTARWGSTASRTRCRKP